MSEYIEITPHHFAVLSLRRAVDAIEQTATNPTNWFFIILDLHRALYCALIAALSGSAEIGAYTDKIKAEWLEYFEKSRTDPNAKPPTGDYVSSFKELLSRAEPQLELTTEQRADILKLNDFRGDLEHIKPQHWVVEVGGLPRMGANVAAAFHILFEAFSYRLEEPEQVEAAISKLKQFGFEHPNSSPQT